MLIHDYLTLRLVRLKPTEKWVDRGSGLSFVFPRGGTGKYVAGSIAQELSPGDVLVLNAGLGGTISAASGGEIVFWYFSLCFEHLFPLFATNEISLLQEVFDGLKSTKLYPASSPLALACHKFLGDVPPHFDLDHRSHLLRVVAAVVSSELKSVRTQRGGYVRIEEHMMQVFEKLSLAELLLLSVGELAAKFSCSRRHLNRLFHQHFGFSVAALRMEMRLLRAVSLLRNPDAKIIHVAEQSGFNHLGLFNTCFKRRFGASPGQWRKLTLQGERQSKSPVVTEPACPLRTSGFCPGTGTPDVRNPAESSVELRRIVPPAVPHSPNSPTHQNLPTGCRIEAMDQAACRIITGSKVRLRA